MDAERLGRVVAVALLALLTPVACAALGVGTPSASGLPPSPGSASPAVQPDDGEEASTSSFTEETNTVRRTGLWAAPVRHLARQHARSRVRVLVPPVNDVVDDQTGRADTRPVTENAWVGVHAHGSPAETALGPATPIPGVTPVASTSTTGGDDISVGLVRHLRSR
jgi:hypothetical protein